MSATVTAYPGGRKKIPHVGMVIVDVLGGGTKMTEISYTVSDMTCGHCTQTVSSRLEQVEGVESVAVDLETKRVVVRGEQLDDTALRAAINEAGYVAS